MGEGHPGQQAGSAGFRDSVPCKAESRPTTRSSTRQGCCPHAPAPLSQQRPHTHLAWLLPLISQVSHHPQEASVSLNAPKEGELSTDPLQPATQHNWLLRSSPAPRHPHPLRRKRRTCGCPSLVRENGHSHRAELTPNPTHSSGTVRHTPAPAVPVWGAPCALRPQGPRPFRQDPARGLWALTREPRLKRHVLRVPVPGPWPVQRPQPPPGPCQVRAVRPVLPNKVGRENRGAQAHPGVKVFRPGLT